MIKVQGLKKQFEDKEVLKGVDIDIMDNETMVILGPSGQGKTVMIKSMIRLIEPDAGVIYFDNEDIAKLNKSELENFRKHIAYVFQNSALFDFLDVRENLALFLRMHKKMKSEEIEEKIMEALSFVGLSNDILEKYPEELSGGMKKRVAIARAMIKEPRYIFYDEPTTGLDKKNAQLVSELIEVLKDKISATSIIVTHDIDLMEKVSDRVALLREGKIIFIGKKGEISDETLEYLYSIGDTYEI
jgi:phospholipid/cholesterol/gamma-HCH transport system ATP-binding protein